MNSHPQRLALHNELHARPRPPLQTPHRISMIALLRPAQGGSEPPEALRRLCRDYRLAEPSSGGHFHGDFGSFRLKWERHGEFDDFTVYRNGADPAHPFSEPAIEALPEGWIDSLAGQCIAATHVTVLGPSPEARDGGTPPPLAFDGDSLIAATIANASARVFTDLQLDAQGFTRFLMLDVAMSPAHTGREVQRLIDIEMYRMMAMLAFPIARAAAAELDQIESQLESLAQRLETAVPADEPQLLSEVTHLAAMIERLSGDSSFRFSAGRAYHALVIQRGSELREQHLSGVQTLTGFLDRRFGPAMAFCESVGNRIEIAAERVARASSLLRTRVEIERETQNQAILAAMNRRARLQLRLQETVEGLSVAAITYYAVGLFAYIAKGLQGAGMTLDPELLTGLAVLPIGLGVALAIRQLRKAIMNRHGKDDGPDL